MNMPAILIITCPHCGKQSDSIHIKYCAKSRSPRAFKPANDMRDESLDCYWCGQRFPDFKPLALHVQNHGVENFEEAIEYYARLGQKEQQTMIISQRNQQLKEVNGNTAGRIVGCRENKGDYQYSEAILMVQIGKEVFDLPVRSFNEDFLAIVKKYGNDTDKWTGKTVKLNSEEYVSKAGKASQIIRFHVQ